jgi:hypothetical protein
MAKEETFWAESIYGVKNQKGLVAVKWCGQKLQITPAEARAMAANLLQAAEAAETDEMIVRWLRDVLHIEEERMGYVLRDFRILRDQLREDHEPDKA